MTTRTISDLGHILAPFLIGVATGAVIATMVHIRNGLSDEDRTEIVAERVAPKRAFMVDHRRTDWDWEPPDDHISDEPEETDDDPADDKDDRIIEHMRRKDEAYEMYETYLKDQMENGMGYSSNVDTLSYMGLAGSYSPDSIHEDDRKDGFRLITEREFHEQKPEYDKLTLDFYIVDDMLVDSHDEIVSDVEYVLGVDHLDAWWLDHGDPDIVHIRNYGISTDYEVCKINGSYLGIESIDDIEGDDV